jgi:uncharacterized protein YraI
VHRYFIIVLFVLAVVAPVSAQQNLLVDPGFEGEAYNLVSEDASADVQYYVPSGWGGGVILAPRDAFWMNVHPTGFPHTAGYKRSGGRSFHMARGGGTFTAYVYQQVFVQPGTDVQGGAQGYIENDVSGAVVRAGIDPTGGTDPFSPNVIWSGFSGNLRNWNFVSVNARASNTGVVTLFLYATQSQPGNPNGVYWDEAFLNGTAGAAPAQPLVPAQPTTQTVSPTVRVNVRSGPGTNFDRIGAASPGESYALLDTSDSNGWYAIDYNGQRAFVFSTFVTVAQGTPTGGGASAPAAPPVESLPFTANYALRLRATPDSTSAELGRVAYTAVVQAVGRTADSAWVQVIANGQIGWVLAQYGRVDGDLSRLPVR